MRRFGAGAIVGCLLAGCAQGSASWTFTTNTGTRTYDGTATVETTDRGERLTIAYQTQGEGSVADDEVSAWIYVELDAMPAAPRELAIAGRVAYGPTFGSGVAQPPDESRWTFTRHASSDPAVQRVLVYWGAFRPAADSYAGDVVGTLGIESVSASELRGTLHLEVGSDAPGSGGTPYFFGPTTSDVTFTATR